MIVRRVLGGKGKGDAKSTLLRSGVVGLSNPSLNGGKLLYVRSTPRGDRLKVKASGAGGSGRTIFRRPRGTMWSTALAAKRAYVTLIAGTRPRQKIVSVAR